MPQPSLSLLVLRSPDLDRLKSFYTALGLRLTAERHGNGPDHYSATLGATVLELYPGDGQVEKGSPGDVRLGFELESLDQIPTAVVGPARPVERDGRRVLIVRDPDGRAVELTERA